MCNDATTDSCKSKLQILARILVILVMISATHFSASAASDASPRERLSFNAGWRFQKGDPADLADELSYPKIKRWLLPLANAFTQTPVGSPANELRTKAEYAKPDFDDSGWRKLNLPHDWGIEGPFKQEYPGDTGKLQWWGVGWYRKQFQLPAAEKGTQLYLDLDGAMSYATVWVNGRFAGGWPYGYSSFRVNLTPFVKFGESNVVAIRLDNPPESSRWYPGGGIYRNVWLVKTSAVHVEHWGTYVTSDQASKDAASVKLKVKIGNSSENVAAWLTVKTAFFAADEEGQKKGEPIATASNSNVKISAGASEEISQIFEPVHPRLWSTTDPNRYVAVTEIADQHGKIVDNYETVFGIRKIEFTTDRGFLLNGERIQLQGVCNHHDLGALGAAFNVRAAQRQLEILKEMGVNALRTTHNPAAPELLDLCDRMGILVMGEAFDCWIWGKTPNDYARLFNDWSERDLRAMIRRDRNHPSIIMWSVGNEIVKVEAPENAEIAKRLVGIVHEQDATRGATSAINNTPVGYNGYQKTFDVFGFNYRSMEYAKFHKANPTIPVYGSETASTVSSRGEYFIPVKEKKDGGKADFQMSSYDLYAPPWAWPPDAEFKWLDEAPHTLGEFVWTGFDYLGEPTPYGDDYSNLLNIADPVQREQLRKELDAMGKLKSPSRSSYFGIVDLAGFKKDRFYLYQSRWRPDLPMAHILPHWNWPGREGQVTPVHVYTSGDEAELFLNGNSLGRRKKAQYEYRLRWDDVKYEPGELKVVVYKNGRHWAEDTVHTTGPAEKLKLQADRNALTAGGAGLVFVTASLMDKGGHVVPDSDNVVAFEVSGPTEIIATDNGDATSHVSFQSKQRPAFNGLVLVIVRTKAGESGTIRVKASSPGLESSEVVLESNATSRK